MQPEQDGGRQSLVQRVKSLGGRMLVVSQLPHRASSVGNTLNRGAPVGRTHIDKGAATAATERAGEQRGRHDLDGASMREHNHGRLGGRGSGGRHGLEDGRRLPT